MTQKDIVPAVIRYSKELADAINAKSWAMLSLSCKAERKLRKKISHLTDTLTEQLQTLRDTLAEADVPGRSPQELANFYRDEVIPSMEALRESADSLEVLVAKDQWPFPSYGDILFSVR